MVVVVGSGSVVVGGVADGARECVCMCVNDDGVPALAGGGPTVAVQ